MKVDARAQLRLMLDPVQIMRAAGRSPDPWQVDLLRSVDGTSSSERILLLCSRQVGKTESVAAYAAWRAIVRRGAVVVCLAPTQRQSTEMLLRVRGYLHAVADLIGPLKREAVTYVEMHNGARIMALPASASGIRGVSATDLREHHRSRHWPGAGLRRGGAAPARRPLPVVAAAAVRGHRPSHT